MARFLLRVACVLNSFMALLWFAGAADQAGLSALVVVTWWSIGGLFAVLALTSGIWAAMLKPRPRRVR